MVSTSINRDSKTDEKGTNLPSATTKLFTSISPSSLPTPPTGIPSLYNEDSSPSLRSTWNAIEKETSDKQPALVILDGLVELSYLGFEPKEIVRFVRAVLALTRKVSRTLDTFVTFADVRRAQVWCRLYTRIICLFSLLHLLPISRIPKQSY